MSLYFLSPNKNTIYPAVPCGLIHHMPLLNQKICQLPATHYPVLLVFSQ